MVTARLHPRPCPVGTAFLQAWESELGETDRRTWLEPLRSKLQGARTGPEAAARRAAGTVGWLVRTWAPTWLELSGAGPNEGLRSTGAFHAISDERARVAATERVIDAIVAARMSAGHWAWVESQRGPASLRDAAERLVSRALPGRLAGSLGRTGFHAALAAIGHGAQPPQWRVLRDHLSGLALATSAGIWWQAAWDAATVGPGDAWWLACSRRVDARMLPVESRLVTLASAHVSRMLSD